MTDTPDYQRILDETLDQVRQEGWSGKVADYIPALAGVPRDRLGMALRTVDGELFAAGDAGERFSLQSISKLFSLTLALGQVGERLFERVGREPSGTAFNSLVQLEHEEGVPRNPFLNAGALVVVDVLLSHSDELGSEFLEFVRGLARLNPGEEPTIDYDREVASSERAWGDRNAALAHFLKSFGNLENPVARVLDAYTEQCSLAMSSIELTAACQFLAQGGRNPADGRRLLTPSLTKRTNALLLTCGVYDAAGDFAYRVGLPGKSGVGGGIVAVMPGRWVAAVWSPALDETGNSEAGMRALELLTTKSGVSIF